MAALTAEERAELNARSSLIGIHRRTADLLESEQRLFLSHLLVEKGLDPSKQYQLDPETGELSEPESPQKDGEPEGPQKE